jgi:hypothetical protein
LFHCFHLPRDLVNAQRVIGVQPLDVVTLTQRERRIPGSGGALIRLAEYAHIRRFVSLRDRERCVRGAVIDDDDFLARPGLAHSRLQCLAEPALVVVSRNEDRYERLHFNRLLQKLVAARHPT